MCLMLLALNQHQDYPFVLLFNRDEQYSRPSAAVHTWQSGGIVAPQDLMSGGTWLGMNKSGHWAALTAYRSGKVLDPNRRSRGLIINDYLQGNLSPRFYVQQLQATIKQYNDFNLICGYQEEVWYFSSRLNQYQRVESGYHALSNAELNTPWPKTIKGLTQLKEKLIDNKAFNKQDLLKIMSDREQASPKSLPHTGIPFAREKKISSIHVANEKDGTCSTTLIMRSNITEVEWTEVSYQNAGDAGITTEVRFTLYE